MRQFRIHLLLLSIFLIWECGSTLHAQDGAAQSSPTLHASREISDLESRFNSIAAVILVSLALTVPTIFLFRGLKRAIRTRRFVPTQGVLIEFEPTYNDAGDCVVFGNLVYRYQIPKDELESTVVGVHPTPAQFEKLWNAWKEGGRVTAYYDPENVGESVLFRGISGGLIMASCACVLAWAALIAYATGFIAYLIKIGFLETGSNDLPGLL